MNQHNDDSYRRAIETYKVLLSLNVVLFQLLLLWVKIAMLIKPA